MRFQADAQKKVAWRTATGSGLALSRSNESPSHCESHRDVYVKRFRPPDHARTVASGTGLTVLPARIRRTSDMSPVAWIA